MTYSLNVEATTRAEAIVAATAEIDAALESGTLPPIAREAVIFAVQAHAVLLPEPQAGEVLGIGVNGSMADYGAGMAALTTQVSVIVKPA